MSAIEKRNPTQQLLDTVRGDEFREQLRQALPENVTVEKFTRVTATALMQTPALAEADKASLFAAVIRAAQDGLYPDGKEAALVIFNTKKGDSWVKAAQYLPMVGGLRKIAAEYGWSIRTALVYENDEFDHDPVAGKVRHRPVRLGQERGEPIGAYAAAEHRDGRTEAEVMTIAEIEKVRGVSRAKDKGPWVDWWERMAEKTPAKRVFAKLPLDPADKRIASVIDASQVEPREAQRLLYGTAPRSSRALAAAPDSSAPAVNESLPSPAESQQAGEGNAAAAADPSAAPGGDEPEPVFGDDDGLSFTEAALTVLPDSQHKGKTLAEVADLGENGATWLWWALRQHARYQGSFRAALETFVREAGVAHPTEGELWQRYERWLSEKAAA